METSDGPEAENTPPGRSITEWDHYINNPPSEPLAAGDGIVDTQADAMPATMIDDGHPYDGDALLLASEADIMKPVHLKLDGIGKQLAELRKEFQFKIKNDAQKDKVINSLHQELQLYKSNHLKKYILPTIMDIIQFIDGVRKLIQYLTLDRPDESESQRIMKLTKVLKSIPSDLEDICSKQGISPFKCSETAFNPGRQRILRKIFMATAEQDKTVAESLRPGYVWDGEVIRPELVSVYIYKAPEDGIETRNTDE